RTSGEKRVFLVILFTSFSGSLVSRIPGAVQNSSFVSIYIDGRDCCQTGQFSQDVADGALTIAPWLPRDETTALTEEAFIGCMATITGYHAVAGSPCEGRFTDRFGQVHYLLLEPEAGKEFRRGDKVIIVCRLSGSRWLGELNPWPDVL
ncbi:OB-fold-containig protein, partial [Escherichia coli]|uniref:OB-fold-containig protein n=35 Tax=Escherichia coli TaxID=562 RepID=UPI00112F7F3D